MIETETTGSALYFDRHVFVCCNRRPDGHRLGCCAARGSEAVRDEMKARVKALGLPRIRVNTASCLGRCEFGPCLVIYPEGVWYRCRTPEDVELILQEHVIGGRRVESLMLPGR